jgi:hypothetical protein
MGVTAKRQELLPPKDAKVLEALAAGSTPEEAVSAAGYNVTPRNAKVIAEHLWKRHVGANNSMLEALANVGVSPERVAQKMGSLLDAQTVVSTRTGIIEVPDNSAQLRAVDLVMKTVGGYAPTKTESVTFSFEQILLTIEGEDQVAPE